MVVTVLTPRVLMSTIVQVIFSHLKLWIAVALQLQLAENLNRIARWYKG